MNRKLFGHGTEKIYKIRKYRMLLEEDGDLIELTLCQKNTPVSMLKVKPIDVIVVAKQI